MQKQYLSPKLIKSEIDGLITMVSLNPTDGEVELSGGDLFGVDDVAE